MSVFILAVSIVTQYAAAVIALLQIRSTGFRLAWGFIAIALILMGVRRSITFYWVMTGAKAVPADPIAESVALLISILMLVGVIMMGRMFRDVSEKSVFLNSIVDNIPNMVFVKEARDLRFALFNKAGETLLGVSRDELAGKNDYDFFPKKQADHFVAKDREALISETITDIPEEPIDTKAHGRRLLHTRKISVRDENGQPQYLLGISEDITEQKKIETKLNEALYKAKEASQAKSEFLALMSHELRTPLNAIIGFAQMLGAEVFGKHSSSKYLEYSQDIEKSGQHLLSLINDVLDLSKIEAGEMAVEPSRFSLHQVVDDSLRFFTNADARRFKTEYEESTDELVADYRMVKQILLNLLSNADKYTPSEGEITVRIERGPNDQIVVSVIDEGVGIPPDEIGKVLEPFRQARVNPEISHHGTGLGLSISKKLMELQGGRLELESKIGEGTCIRLHFVSQPS